MKIHDISHLPDPCPLPDKLKKRTLVEKERLLYAPFSGVGGIVYDKDAVYVELGGSHSHARVRIPLEHYVLDFAKKYGDNHTQEYPVIHPSHTDTFLENLS